MFNSDNIIRTIVIIIIDDVYSIKTSYHMIISKNQMIEFNML